MSTKLSEITLPAQLTSLEAGELYNTVTGLKQSNEHCQFDGHLVEYVDFAGVQFLLACQSTLSSDGETVVINASDVLLQSIADIGALELIGLDNAANEKVITHQ